VLRVSFSGGRTGAWRIDSLAAVRGETLPDAERLEMREGDFAATAGAVWVLRGVTSNERYTTRGEHDALRAREEPLGRPRAPRAALIPVRKSAA